LSMRLCRLLGPTGLLALMENFAVTTSNKPQSEARGNTTGRERLSN